MYKGAGAVGGVLGALAMTALGGIARAVGVPLELELLLGSAVTGSVGASAWVAGLALHLSIGALLGTVYGAILDDPGVPVSVRSGVAIGALHAVIAGLLLGVLAPLHPLVPGELPDPGSFASNLGGAAAILFIVQRLVFGAVVGAVCAAVPQYRPRNAEMAGA